ncbi:4'-phosphopantetheinyl transferase [Lutimaribacter marinistellae]|uniref:Enterobactin synthase component D n=1 Tax=Lutimaribacter marinistellae TaxID=1820329 RepID=A0ABV7TFC7_9RHOB
MNGAEAELALMLAAPLFDSRIALASTDPRRAYDVYPEEIAALGGAVDKRRREFAAGRMAARLALRDLGAPAMAVPVGDDRAPIWPPGLVGSITHTDVACLAVAAWEGEVAMLGLDLEPDQPLDEDLVREICTETERDWLAEQTQPGLAAKVIFSAKEAVYKAQYTRSRTLFGFDTLHVMPDLAGGAFAAEFRRDVPGFASGRRIDGKLVIGHGFILTAVAEPA